MNKTVIDSEELRQLNEDAKRWRWFRKNCEWHRQYADRHDTPYAYPLVRLPVNTNLSCAVMVDHAIDREMRGEGMDKVYADELQRVLDIQAFWDKISQETIVVGGAKYNVCHVLRQAYQDDEIEEIYFDKGRDRFASAREIIEEGRC